MQPTALWRYVFDLQLNFGCHLLLPEWWLILFSLGVYNYQFTPTPSYYHAISTSWPQRPARF
jgi:hypothetical protein